MAMRAQFEQHIEVHKYGWAVVPTIAFLALTMQTFLPRYLSRADLLELPLLITLYFSLSRRNPSTGLLLGMVIGLLQDAVSRIPIGLYGIAKTLVGFAASSIGGKIDVEHPLARMAFTFLFFYFHQFVFSLTRQLLLRQPQEFFTVNLLVAAIVNSAVSIVLFPLLDRLRKPS
ncbi:MAG: rod shape-determining protein MreD [Acidobacteria bacterium]|nr:rod shape-determining protein MreD [Acidobacteriota bacterium]